MNRMPPAVEMDVVVGPKAEGARRATGAFGPTTTSAATTTDMLLRCYDAVCPTRISSVRMRSSARRLDWLNSIESGLTCWRPFRSLISAHRQHPHRDRQY